MPRKSSTVLRKSLSAGVSRCQFVEKRCMVLGCEGEARAGL